MGSALYISIKDPPRELDTMMSGKALAGAWETLDAAAETIGVPPINKLCNSSWKAPEKGLPIFEKYLEYVAAHPTGMPDAAEVIEDLKDVLRLIGVAQGLGTKWRLMLDY
jgi:hypothetical protein